MYRNIFFKLLIFTVVLFNINIAFSLDINEVTILQKDLEQKAQNILDKYIGANNSVVNVIISLKKENVTTYMYTNEENKLNNKPADEDIAKTNENLPGYSILAPKQKVFDSVNTISKTTSQVSIEQAIDRINVSMVIDNRIDNKKVAEVEKIIPNVLKLDLARGDKLQTLRLDFNQAPITKVPETTKGNEKTTVAEKNPDKFASKLGNTLKSPDVIKIYVIYGFILVIVLILSMVFIIGISIIARQIRVTAPKPTEDQKAAAPATKKEEEAEETLPDVLQTQAAGSSGRGKFEDMAKKIIETRGGEKPLFGFINENNIGKLPYLLKNQSIEKKIAVLNFIRPDLAAILFQNFSLADQKDLVINLSLETKLSPDEIRQFSNEIEAQIDFLVGGKSFTQQIFDYVNNDVSKVILYEVGKENKKLADDIANNIFVFEDLQYLEKRYVQAIVRNIGVKDFSIALGASDEKFTATIYSFLSEGVVDLLKQSMSLMKQQPRSKINEVQQKVVQQLRALNKEGFIASKKDLIPGETNKTISEPNNTMQGNEPE
ncbi:MAG: FliG C-terminal domain-containing protein [Candidatus Margulisbacteria bacterium]|nr:FliG C-terminal domain-containing protein [Candidatus Margulisiibacteriota bacterium]